MIRSMTGFARAVSQRSEGGLGVEIRSLNHRYLELTIKIPPSLSELEDRVRELCQSRIRRGKVTLAVSEADGGGLEAVTLNESVLRFYLAAIRNLERRLGLRADLSVRDLLGLPQIFSIEKKAGDPNRRWSSLKSVVGMALDRLEKSRLQEGRRLAEDILGRLGKIEKSLSGIEEHAKGLPQAYYERLRKRVQELLGDATVDPDRLSREAVIWAEKSDVTEEFVRLRSHIRLFREKLAGNREVGKELDFILQEMNREINTLGSKAQDFGVSKEVVSVKAELEKIREQVQNIE